MSTQKNKNLSINPSCVIFCIQWLDPLIHSPTSFHPTIGLFYICFLSFILILVTNPKIEYICYNGGQNYLNNFENFEVFQIFNMGTTQELYDIFNLAFFHFK